MSVSVLWVGPMAAGGGGGLEENVRNNIMIPSIQNFPLRPHRT